MNIQWENGELTRAKVTVEAADSRWWRRRFVTAEVEYVDKQWDYTCWAFVVGGDRHDVELAQFLEDERRCLLWEQQKAAERAQLKNPWSPIAPLPAARTVKR